MKIYKIEDLKKIQNEQNYRYIALFDSAGQQIIPFNPNRVTNETRLREIETRLISQGLPDGYYVVKCKNSTGKTVRTDDYTFYKGDNLSEGLPPAPQIVEKAQFTPEVLTYDGALKLQIELERLKLENAALKKDMQSQQSIIDSLKAELAEAETLSEESEGNSTLWENAKGFLSELVGIGAPLLDKHFELKEKQLALRAMELQSLRPANPKPEVKPNREEHNKKLIEDFILTYQDDADTYEQLATLYNEATSQEDFLKNLKVYDESIFNALTNGK